jgi:hypothetical protein
MTGGKGPLRYGLCLDGTFGRANDMAGCYFIRYCVAGSGGGVVFTLLLAVRAIWRVLILR